MRPSEIMYEPSLPKTPEQRKRQALNDAATYRAKAQRLRLDANEADERADAHYAEALSIRV